MGVAQKIRQEERQRKQRGMRLRGRKIYQRQDGQRYAAQAQEVDNRMEDMPMRLRFAGGRGRCLDTASACRQRSIDLDGRVIGKNSIGRSDPSQCQ